MFGIFFVFNYSQQSLSLQSKPSCRCFGLAEMEESPGSAEHHAS